MKKKIINIIRLAILLFCICGVCLSFTDEELEIINNVENPYVRESLLNIVGNNYTIDWNMVKSYGATNIANDNIVLENTNIVDENTEIETTSTRNIIDSEKLAEEQENEYWAMRERHIESARKLAIIEEIVGILGLALIVLAVYKKISVKKIIKKYEEENIENDNQKDQYRKIKEIKDKAQNSSMFCIIGAIILFMLFMIINIVSNFAAKPIIYIYPEVETEVSVKLGNPEKITCSYPKYEGEWKVQASPNGELVDLKTGRNLYSLYWEGINSNSSKMKEGFIVKGEDTIEFLEEKLEILGLNEREAEEFIIYWLPKMEKNNYNYIRFETMEEINENMPLEIEPSPDTLIRVMMDFKGLSKPINVETQELEKVERNGYTVVEWGGTEI